MSMPASSGIAAESRREVVASGRRAPATASLPMSGPSTIESRSDTISPSVSARLRATATESTARPAIERLGVRGGAEGEAQQLAQRRPLGVPGAVGPLVDGERGGEMQGRPELRRAQRGRADQHGIDRVLLLRHRRRASAGALGELADLGAGEGRDVGGEDSQRVDHLHERVAELGHGPAGRVPRRVGRREPELGRVGGGQSGCRGRIALGGRDLDERGQGAARAAELCGKRGDRGAQALGRPPHPAQPVRRAQADGRRHGVLGQGAGRGDLVAVPGRELREVGLEVLERRVEYGARATRDEDERGVEDVLARGSAVHRRLRRIGHAVPEDSDQGDHGVAARHGREGERRASTPWSRHPVVGPPQPRASETASASDASARPIAAQARTSATSAVTSASSTAASDTARRGRR